VKGYHVFQTGRPRETFLCEREGHNPYSEAAIVVKIGDSVVGHVPDRLAVVLAPLLDCGRVANITGTITGPPRSSPDGVWTVGRGIELPCEYVLRGAKQDRSPVRKALRQAQTEKKRSTKRKEPNKR